MKKITKVSLQGSVLGMVLTLPTYALAGFLNQLKSQCQCITEQATLGQLISLGVMLTLVAGIFAAKLFYRHELAGPGKKDEIPAAEDSSIQTLRQLKIGERFSDWSQVHRLASQKQPIS